MQPKTLPVRTGHYRAFLACLILFTVVIGNNFNTESNSIANSTLTSVNQNIGYLSLAKINPTRVNHFSVFATLLQVNHLAQALSNQNQSLYVKASKLDTGLFTNFIVTTFSLNLLHSIYIAAP